LLVMVWIAVPFAPRVIHAVTAGVAVLAVGLLLPDDLLKRQLAPGRVRMRLCGIRRYPDLRASS
jgi:hypothetical protein